MEVRIECDPSYALAYCILDHAESVRVERGAMAMMSDGVSVAADTGPGGIAKAAIRKRFGGESFFMGRYTAQVHQAWVAVAPPYPGDIHVRDLRQGGMLVESGSVLALSEGVSVDVRYAGLQSMVLREGVTLLRVHGDGLALVCSYGGMQEINLAPGQSIVVDTGHLVGMSDTCQLKVGPLGSFTTAAATGEGMVGRVTGPGAVLVQTRAEQALQSWLFPERGQNAGTKR